MTVLHTASIPHLLHVTHEHGWVTESHHRTSEGLVIYERCSECSARRVDLQGHPSAPPERLSRSIEQSAPSAV